MIYLTFNLNPLPCMSVRLIISPPEMEFNILVVAAATFGFFVLAPTAIPINGAATLTAGFRNFFQAVWDPLKLFSFYFWIHYILVEIAWD